MRLANSILTVKIGKERFTLSPSLRAVCRLHSRFTIEKLHKDIMQGSITALAALVAETSIQPVDEVQVAYALADNLQTLESLVAPLTELIEHLCGIDDTPNGDKPPKTSKKAKRITFEQSLTNFYRIATGWLGWTPKEAWTATPLEIMEAFEGRKELYGEALEVIATMLFGKKEEEPELDLEAPLDREGLASLKAMAGAHAV